MQANRVTYAHAGLSEWYANGPLGLEQGFTIPRAPSGHPAGPLTLSMALSGNVHTSLAYGGQSITLSRAGGPSLHYSGLRATDARGRALHSWLQLQNGRLLLRVEARNASYPLQIDPFVQGEELAQGETSNRGPRVAISADGTVAAVIGVTGAGVFTRSGSTWTEQSFLPFEGTLAMSGDGDTILIGQVGGRGEVQWYERFGSTWVRGESEAVESDGSFGQAVALSADGNTALIAGKNTATWFTRFRGGVWIRQQIVGPFAGFSGDSVALSADGATALVGSRGGTFSGGHVFVFVHSGSHWSEQAQIEGGDRSFGTSVALSADGDTVLVGAEEEHNNRGTAWVFTRSGTTWNQQTVLSVAAARQFGGSVALSSDGGTALIGARATGPCETCLFGAAWVFTRSGSTWSQQEELTLNEPNEYFVFGFALALSGDGLSALITSDETVWSFAQTLPVVTALSPNNGPDAGGTPVTITGANFTHATDVRFGSTSATSFTVNSDTSITAFAPPGTGTVDVTVTTSEGTSPASTGDRFTYGPVVTSVSPNAGPSSGGTTVTITGANLTGSTAVTFGSTEAASFTVNSDTAIRAESPPGIGTVDVTVTTSDGTSPTSATDQFTYVPAPTVADVSPHAGPEAGGTSVNIKGTGFAGTASVSFGATATTFTINSDTSITAVSPPGAGTVDVTVTTLGGISATSAADQFTYQKAPDFGRCLKVTKGTGQFESASCTKLGGEKKFAWYPGVVKTHFTTNSSELTAVTLQPAKGSPVTCTAETGRGEYTGPKTVSGVILTLTGCIDAGAQCMSGAVAGEIVSNPLEGTLGVEKLGATSSKNKIGLDLFSVGKTGPVVEFACGLNTVSLRGSVIVPVKANKMRLTQTLKFKASKGKQKPESFVGEPKDILEASFNGEPFEQTGLTLTATQTNEEAVEVNSVV